MKKFEEVQIGRLFHYASLLDGSELRVKLGKNFAIRLNDRKAQIETVVEPDEEEVFEWEKGDCPNCGGTHLCHSCGLPAYCPPDEPFVQFSFCDECDSRLKKAHESAKGDSDVNQ
jgi:hypothetical protein